jgi:hypothetical protein
MIFCDAGVWSRAPVTVIFLSLALAGCAHNPEPVRALPPTESSVEYHCRRVSDRAIRVDGDLTDKAWARAIPLDRFQTAGPKPAPAAFASTARLLWSDKRLFLAFDCKTDAIRSKMTNRDDDIWNEECAEIFLCPRGPEAKYYEFEFNPLNTIYDSMLSSWRYEEQVKHYKEWKLAYNAKIASATRVQRDAQGKVTGWTAEAAIPFADLAQADHVPPRVGDVWLFNVFRIAQINETKCEYSARVPTMADFHRPWKFPRLKFGE